MNKLTILGATGSIGENTLDVVRQHLDKYQIIALAACQNVTKMFKHCVEFQPRYAVMSDEKAAELLTTQLTAAGSSTTVLAGVNNLATIAALPEVDSVMCAIVGGIGLTSTLAAVQAGKKVLCANKESLVMAGQLIISEVHKSGATLIPVDSEHSAIFQCLSNYRVGVNVPSLKRIILTASGGPFRGRSPASLASVTPAEALAHPTWIMGPKISIDSATMMNKALEVIEAHWLFATPATQIDIFIHPQSIVHSMVEFYDGSVLAQLGMPDMRVPIAVALAWPERISLQGESLNLLETNALQFEPLDHQLFPVVNLAYQAIKIGGTSAAILNAANEILVAAFLKGQISFPDISRYLENIMSTVTIEQTVSLASVQYADQMARVLTQELVMKKAAS